ncbi:flagellar hook-associated protein 2 [Sphingomonas sp. YR710]|jgi:flagellar hook-associated protein 2|uniref:flagellar filament capping protein FliD n=1 Tax=Sphingomonas sp. YR710 TaxID=1882773 RepID=UPI0008803321|nr:flagellar filament capping protein FliD [Sphingomonas sp. YR710]SDC96223.1 flagellar hook-associated protein 2 [Sphingomonas sp. YR710]
MVSSVGSTITQALGAGSIDTASLVDQLANANSANQTAALNAKDTANAAKISDLASAISTIGTFSTSLQTLTAGGTLFTQPTTSNSSILQVSALPGARLGELSSTIKVGQLATGQTLSSPALASSATSVGQGTLLLTVGTKTATITIDSTNDSMAGLALAIKNSGLGVSASTVTDNAGTRLVVKGATGTANAFSLSMSSGDATGIGRFTFDPTTYDPNNITGFERTQQAQNAELTVDGVAISKASNSFSDVIQGVKIDLQSAAPGTSVTIGANRPTAGISQAVSDFVSAYNEMKTTLNKMTDPKTGSLRGDNGIRELVRRLSQLTSTALTYATDGGPTTLAEIGVSTNQDGSLSLDTARLSTVMSSNPDAVEAMLNPAQRSDNALIQITSAVGKTKGGIYTVTNATAANSTTPARADIDGSPALPYNDGVIASFFSAANGLTFTPLGTVASATITVDLGLQGALAAIKDTLTSSSGALTASQSALDAEKTSIAAAKDKLAARDTTYRAQLTTQFAAMQKALLAYSSTQSYLTQQVKVWTNSTSGN